MDFHGEDGTYNQSVSSIAVLPGTQEGCWEYYLLDDKTNQPEENPLAVINLPLSKIRVGASVSESPFGVIRPTNPTAMTLVLPMSMKRTEPVMPEIAVSISDYNTFLDYLKSEKYEYMDYLDTQMSYRNYLSMIQVFSYGFIILISLICICNVFNTISTNISLRRKDFGMLRSIGMRDREIRHMIAFECMQYGLCSILWGIPLSICAYALITQISSLRYETSFSIPVESIFIAAACILITVFITMCYAVSMLRAQNPIEAIRCDF